MTTTTQHHVGPSTVRLTWRADLALVVAAFFWGTTFVVVKDAVDQVAPLAFLGVRFLIGAAVLAVVARSRPATPHELRHGMAAGLALLAGFALQTFGLQHTDPATSAFLTYLLVVFVPIIGFVVLRKPLHPATGVGIALAMIGLVLLTGGAGGSFGRGELLTLACAVAFAVHIVILGQTAARHDAVRLTCIQVVTVGVASTLLSLAGSIASGDGSGDLVFGGAPLVAAAFCGIAATAVAFFLMVWAQRSVSPSRAALILLLEPVFAALLSWLGGDSLTLASAAGGLLILVAVGVAELVPDLLTHRSR